MRYHGIRFENCENNWSNGLPLGNGVFGTMISYQKGKMFVPLNHYENYYNISASVLPEDQLKNWKDSDDPGAVLRERTDRAKYNIPGEGEAFTWYGDYRNGMPTTMALFSGSYPQTGDLCYSFSDELKECESLLALSVEDAKVTLECKKDKKSALLETIIARKDCAITKIKQSEKGLISELSVSYPAVRDADAPDVEFYAVSDCVFGWQATWMLPGSQENAEPYTFTGTVRLCGATATLEEKDRGCVLKVNGNKEFTVITAVCTKWRYDDCRKAGIELCEQYEKDLISLYKEHKKYWKDYFSHCSIELPDEFIERVWYINQYALECCSGEGGIMKHHACGLNGLWDVKRPTLWGSLWYWDVNIQAAFAGVFSSNHMHLGKVFSDGLNTYTELARKYSVKNHNKTGIAFDYPYMCYFSVWPWCAQYLWQYYEYTMDLEYLRNEAYPLFLGMCEFALQLFQKDEKTGKYFVYPDISPEQGPLSHGTTITLAASKNFFRFTLKSAELLGDNNEMLPKIRDICDNLLEYATTEEGGLGKRFKDCAEAPANLWIRHPGMMMPVFPAGEIGINTDCSDEEIEIAKNTLNYLEDRCETGIFGGSWLAASAARLGKGQTALRLLYEKGIDHMLRSNGLSAEETERFINLCLNMRQPIYYPCMMEYTGEMLAALNEMLIQSFGECISVFPAIPDGDPEYFRLFKYGYSHEDYKHYCNRYDAWKDVRFDTMRARGAFLVSAELKDGALKFIKVDSIAGERARITSPFISKDICVYKDGNKIDFVWENQVICFDTKKGCEYIIAKSPADYSAPVLNETADKVEWHESAACKWKVYLGENKETAYNKALDSVTRDRMYGDLHVPCCNVYRFDFGDYTHKKRDADYNADRAPEYYWSMQERTSPSMIRLRMISPKDRLENGYVSPSHNGMPWYNDQKPYDCLYTVQQGFGFKDIENMDFVDREAPDCLRRDFAEGKTDNEFIIELPAGEYELFTCSGDQAEDSFTSISVNGGEPFEGKLLKAGDWQTVTIPLILREDGHIRVKLSSASGYKWKLNYLILNQLKRLL